MSFTTLTVVVVTGIPVIITNTSITSPWSAFSSQRTHDFSCQYTNQEERQPKTRKLGPGQRQETFS